MTEGDALAALGALVPVDVWHAVQAAAKARRKEPATIVREAIEEWIERNGEK